MTLAGAVVLFAVLVLAAVVRPAAFTNLADPPAIDGPIAEVGTPDPAPAGGSG